MKNIFLIIIITGWVTSSYADKKGFFISLDYLTPTQEGTKYTSEYIPSLHLELIASTVDVRNEIESIYTATPEQRNDILNTLIPYYTFKNEETKQMVLQNTLDLIDFAELRSSEEMSSFLNSRLKNKSYTHKIYFLANLLSSLSQNYDTLSLNSDYKEVPISDSQMLESLNHFILTGEQMPIGVCRHMHQFAIRVAKEMGIQNAFGVGYRTINGGHRTLVLNLPDKPNEVIQLNYGQVSTLSNNSGSNSLTQNHSIPSTGIKLTIHNGDNEAVISLPSEEGSILNLAAGMKDSDLGAAHKNEASIAQIGLKSKYGTFRVFKSQSPFDTTRTTQGLGYQVPSFSSRFLEADFSIVGFTSERIIDSGHSLESNGVYAAKRAKLKLDVYTSKNINLQAFTKLNSRFAIFCSTLADEECETNKDGFVSNQLGLTLKLQGKNYINSSTVAIESQWLKKDSTYQAKGSAFSTPVLSFVNKLEIDYSEDLYGIHEIGIVRYDLGTQSHTIAYSENKIGYSSYDAQLYHRYQTALDKNAPIWLPGAEEKNTYGIQKSFFGKKLKLFGHYTQSEMTGNNFGLNIEYFHD